MATMSTYPRPRLPLGQRCSAWVGRPRQLRHAHLLPVGVELLVHDLVKNNRASLTMSLAQGRLLHRQRHRPGRPHLRVTSFHWKGPVLETRGPRGTFAREALFTRHPAMEAGQKATNGLSRQVGY